MSQHDEPDHEERPTPAGNVVRAFSRNRAFVEEVVRENELLRYKVLHLQQELVLVQRTHRERAGDVMSENYALRRQLDEIKEKFDALARQSEVMRERFQGVEQQNESLLNLYVSSYQLHSTLQEPAALGTLGEILLNLLGAEVFAVWILGERTGRMELAAVTDECGLLGGVPPRIPSVALPALRRAETWFSPGGEAGAICSIPLKLEERTVGVLVIHKLLSQKSGFSPLDEELMGLLAAQAAATLIGARLNTRSGSPLAWDPADDGSGATP